MTYVHGAPPVTGTARSLVTGARADTIDRISHLLDQVWRDDPSLSAPDRVRLEAALIDLAGVLIKQARLRDEVTLRLSVTATAHRLVADARDDGAPVESESAVRLIRAMVDELSMTRHAGGNVWHLECERETSPGGRA